MSPLATSITCSGQVQLTGEEGLLDVTGSLRHLDNSQGKSALGTCPKTSCESAADPQRARETNGAQEMVVVIAGHQTPAIKMESYIPGHKDNSHMIKVDARTGANHYALHLGCLGKDIIDIAPGLKFVELLQPSSGQSQDDVMGGLQSIVRDGCIVGCFLRASYVLSRGVAVAESTLTQGDDIGFAGESVRRATEAGIAECLRLLGRPGITSGIMRLTAFSLPGHECFAPSVFTAVAEAAMGSNVSTILCSSSVFAATSCASYMTDLCQTFPDESVAHVKSGFKKVLPQEREQLLGDHVNAACYRSKVALLSAAVATARPGRPSLKAAARSLEQALNPRSSKEVHKRDVRLASVVKGLHDALKGLQVVPFQVLLAGEWVAGAQVLAELAVEVDKRRLQQLI
ncbi:hypothetical protein N2152v2_002295 [Parachlorella kessleri]